MQVDATEAKQNGEMHKIPRNELRSTGDGGENSWCLSRHYRCLGGGARNAGPSRVNISGTQFVSPKDFKRRRIDTRTDCSREYRKSTSSRVYVTGFAANFLLFWRTADTGRPVLRATSLSENRFNNFTSSGVHQSYRGFS